MERFPQDRRSGVFSLFSAAIFAAAILFSGHAIAIGEVTVSPTRVVFEGNARKAHVALINRGSETQTYRISWSRKRMTENGDFENIDTPRPGEGFSDTMVRFSPRQVELPPGKPQTVRLLLRKPPNLETGEYRSYLTFTALPSAEKDGVEQLIKGRDDISIQLRPVTSISIPIIVRHGKTEANASIDNLTLKKTDAGGKKLAMTLQLRGNRSLHGDIVVEFHPDSGEPLTVGRALGISVFPPGKQRRFELSLEAPEKIDLTSGQLQVRYLRPASKKGDDAPLAEAVLRLP